MRLKGGISSVVAGTIMVLLITLGVVPLVMLYINTMQEAYRAYSLSSSLKSLKGFEYLSANITGDTLTVENVGSIPVSLSYITLKDRTGYCDVIVNAYDVAVNATLDSSKVTLDPQNKVVVMEPKGYIRMNTSLLGLSNVNDVCSVVTSRGNNVVVRKAVLVAEKALTLVATSVSFDVATLTSRSDITVSSEEVGPAEPTSNDTNAGLGMQRTSYSDPKEVTALVRVFEAEAPDSVVKVRGANSVNISYNNILIGYDPSWSRSRVGPARYNILISGYEDIAIEVSKNYAKPLIKENKSTYIIIDKGDFYEIRISGAPYRIKIVGYTPSSGNLILYYDKFYNGTLIKLVNENALGYWWLYSDQYISGAIIGSNVIHVRKGYFELNGTAREVIIYMDADSIGLNNILQGSYDPYLFSADVDGNGYPELVFVTEDESCSSGSLTLHNDVGHTYSIIISEIDNTWAYDWSVRPFLINLTGYNIDGSKIALVQVAIRAYIHDNMLDSTELIQLGGLGIPLSSEVKDRSKVLFGIYVIDSANGRVVSSREWTFDEVDRYENTFPPNKNFVTLTASLSIPGNGTYYLAIGFQDPYGYSVDGYDDGDFIIAIEVMSITYYARS